VNVKAMASKAVSTSSQNKTLKKILGFGSLGVVLAIGLMIASVIIGVTVMKDTQVQNGVLSTRGSSPVPVQTEAAVFEREVSVFSDTTLLDATTDLKVPLFVNGMNSTLNMKVLSYLRTPGQNIVFIGLLYSVVITKDGYYVVQNNPNSNPFGANTRNEPIDESKVIFRFSRSFKTEWMRQREQKKRDEVGNDDLVSEQLVITSRSQSFTAESSTSSSTSDPRTLGYYGGTILTSVNIYPIYWSGNPMSCPNLPNFYSAFVKSSVFTSLLSQYSSASQKITTGTAYAPYVARNVPTSTSIQDSDIINELINLFNSGSIPKPGPNNLYMVHFPPGYSITQAGGAQSCVVFCGYHGGFYYGNTPVYYGVIPDMSTGGCAYGCGGGSVCDNTYAVSSHEVAESVTDAGVAFAYYYGPPLGWYNCRYGEVGDICNGQHTTISTPTGTYTVQRLWSNQQNACV